MPISDPKNAESEENINITMKPHLQAINPYTRLRGKKKTKKQTLGYSHKTSP